MRVWGSRKGSCGWNGGQLGLVARWRGGVAIDIAAGNGSTHSGQLFCKVKN
jgi:hypothetical protein